ncbi:uncharacterized protein LOC128169762 [Crassostrea angulata]|uniref:uncharacterized protein LOC128169762 n=1 Tax=Magallana angulata TaxID=2784310 RepID=UPI0022B1F75F|nr:uncharacterized protein LOC128169762 [Crassostrea angulata]
MHVFESYLIDENDPKYEALRKFVLETLGKFSRKIREVGIKLENLEKKLDSGTECAKFEADLDQIHKKIDKEVKPEFENALSFQISQVNSRIDELEMALVNPKKRKMIDNEEFEEEETEAKIATSVEELNENIRKEVAEVFKSIERSYRKEQEKVSKLQLAYIHYWLGLQETISPTKMVDIQNLIKDGVEDRIWSEGWKPDVRGDFTNYLQDKVKKIVKKKRAINERTKLQQELDNLVGNDLQ